MTFGNDFASETSEIFSSLVSYSVIPFSSNLSGSVNHNARTYL